MGAPAIRRAELMAALSVAVDLGLGDASEHAQRAALIAVALADAAGVAAAEAQDAYYLALLRTVGCTGDHDFAFRIFGEDAGDWAALSAMGAPSEMLGNIVSKVGRDARGVRRVARVARALAALPELMRNQRIHCEVGTMLSVNLGLGPAVVAGLGQVFERWDGHGGPARLRGEAIARPVRIAQLAGDIELATRKLGVDGASTLLRTRAGKGHDPDLVELFCADGAAIAGAAERTATWAAVLAAEPGAHDVLTGPRLDRAIRSLGEFADMKSIYTRGHSAAVADLAAAASTRLGLGADAAQAAGWAGHLHDLGRVSVFAYVWDKPGPLSEAEWERVRMHSYFTERVLARLGALGPAVTIASLAHERQGGLGYHRRLSGSALPAAARALAAADVYHALVSPRPHRPARSAAEAEAELRAEADAGRLDADAVAAVLEAAGHPSRHRRELPAGLTSREVEVLRLLARGLTNKEIANALAISSKTAGHHVEHIFAKTKVTTRAAAALYAMQNDLLIEAAAS